MTYLVSLKNLMMVKIAVCLGFGPLLLLLPGLRLRPLGTSYGPGAALTARVLWSQINISALL